MWKSHWNPANQSGIIEVSRLAWLSSCHPPRISTLPSLCTARCCFSENLCSSAWPITHFYTCLCGGGQITKDTHFLMTIMDWVYEKVIGSFFFPSSWGNYITPLIKSLDKVFLPLKKSLQSIGIMRTAIHQDRTATALKYHCMYFLLFPNSKLISTIKIRI